MWKKKKIPEKRSLPEQSPSSSRWGEKQHLGGGRKAIDTAPVRRGGVKSVERRTEGYNAPQEEVRNLECKSFVSVFNRVTC